MNAFIEHHRSNLELVYSCFDHMLLNIIQQPLQQPASIVNFFHDSHPHRTLTSHFFCQISSHYHSWVHTLARELAIPIVVPPKGVRREDWVEEYYHQPQTEQHGIAVILKSREKSKVTVSYKTTGLPHLEVIPRWVLQYNFYLQDADFGRLFLRICPYFPFNSRMSVNGHSWLACRLAAEGIDFRQSDNAFLSCAKPARLQELADSFGPEHIQACAQRWLSRLLPFWADRRFALGFKVFVSQAEYCTNLVFHQRARLDRLLERLLDDNRSIGRPDQLATIFGKRLTQKTAAGIRTVISDYHLGNPCLRSQIASNSIKQYVRDHRLFRTEAATNQTPQLGVNKAISNLPELREKLHATTDRYLEVQQDILETYVDRDQLQQLRNPSVSPSGRRTPGIKLDDLRLLGVMQALTCFAYLTGSGVFRTAALLPRVLEALGQSSDTYSLTRLRYDLGKLRAKGLVQKIAGTHDYRLTPDGYCICVLFLKLFHKVYAPLTAGVLEPFPGDRLGRKERIGYLDRLYRAVDQALQKLLSQVGLKNAG